MRSQRAVLACSICGMRNYRIRISSRTTQRLELKKYCKHCRRVTLHHASI
ncbi:50S ribosomal protein L33 [Fructilactobacillus florum]|nr:50S ribosomal protein L33 [Fructilactobacillus florum]